MTAPQGISLLDWYRDLDGNWEGFLRFARREEGIEVAKLLRCANQHGMHAAGVARSPNLLSQIGMDEGYITEDIVKSATRLELRWWVVMLERVKAYNRRFDTAEKAP